MGKSASPQKSRAGRVDELIAGQKALEQTLRVCSRACSTIKDSKQPVFKLFLFKKQQNGPAEPEDSAA
jgi:hypothetical protein